MWISEGTNIPSTAAGMRQNIYGDVLRVGAFGLIVLSLFTHLYLLFLYVEHMIICIILINKEPMPSRISFTVPRSARAGREGRVLRTPGPIGASGEEDRRRRQLCYFLFPPVSDTVLPVTSQIDFSLSCYKDNPRTQPHAVALSKPET